MSPHAHGDALWSRQPDLDLTVVVPYFNPGERLRATVDELLKSLAGTNATFEVIAVSDGSTDGSEDSLVGLCTEQVRAVRLHHHHGKGEALRAGFAMGRGRFLGFIDADGDLPPDQIVTLAALASSDGADESHGADSPDGTDGADGRDDVSTPDGTDGRDDASPVVSKLPDVVLGTKRHPRSEVVYPPLRRFYSWMWQQLVFVLFRLHVRDTQTGLKLIRREVLAAVLPRMVEKRFAFDLELLVVARHLGYQHFVEIPVRIRQRFGSTVSVRAAGGMLVDLLAIFYRLRVLHSYDVPVKEG